MPRESLLFLLAFAVLLNVALLLGVVLVRLQAARPGTEAGAQAPSPRTGRRTSGPVERPTEPEGSRSSGSSPVPAAEPLLSSFAGRRESAGSMSLPPGAVSEPGEAEPVAEPVLAEPVAAEPVAAEPVAATQRVAPSPSARRGRRFVLPKLEEDRGRAERAIQAVLGEGPSTQSPDSSAAHRPRRRSRRHRPSGPVEHTSIDVAVRGLDELSRRVGPDAGDRLIDAVRGTIHAHLRSGDRTIDLGEGRLRLIVETDGAGAASAAERLRGLTAPWLAAAAVPLSLRIALPTPDAVEDVVAS